MKKHLMILVSAILFCSCGIEDIKDDIIDKIDDISDGKPVLVTVETQEHVQDSYNYIETDEFSCNEFLYLYFALTDSDKNTSTATIEIWKGSEVYDGPVIIEIPENVYQNYKNVWRRKPIKLDFPAGLYGIKIFVTDNDGNESNTLMTSFNVSCE